MVWFYSFEAREKTQLCGLMETKELRKLNDFTAFRLLQCFARIEIESSKSSTSNICRKQKSTPEFGRTFPKLPCARRLKRLL